MHVLIWLTSGLVAGALARWIARAPRWGLLGDAALGTLGAVLGGAVLRVTALGRPDDRVLQVAGAALGAAAALALLRAVDRALARRPAPEAAPHPPQRLEAQIARLGALERRLLARVLRREPVARDPNAAFDEQLTWGERVADRVAAFGGSWSFIGLFAATLLAWILYNSEAARRFDPFPFILLNLLLSCLAAIQAPVILMSQNRMAAKDRLDARHDYEVNLKAEMEIAELHAKVDALVADRWHELLALQARQIEALERIEQRLAAHVPRE